jgi:fructose-1,6-bisphosphatase/inositol monophosphatase family enzyme
MQNVDLIAVERIIRDVGRSEIMPRFGKLKFEDIERKPDNSFVTIADKNAERALIALLTAYWPGSVVVGEEGFEEDPGILSHLSGTDYVWVVDPIDGTSNYKNGIAEFASMVALVYKRKTIAAWICDPSSGDTLMAEEGSGVWLHRDEAGGRATHRMRLAGQDPTFARIGIIGSRLKKFLHRKEASSLFEELPVLQAGSAAAFDYGRLFVGDAVYADSKADRAAFLLYRNSKPWDHLPGLFLLTEAKGYAADLGGYPYNLGENDGLLVAPDKASWLEFQEKLKPVIAFMIAG